jgi:hypothetical protein
LALAKREDRVTVFLIPAPDESEMVVGAGTGARRDASLGDVEECVSATSSDGGTASSFEPRNAQGGRVDGRLELFSRMLARETD